MRYIFQAVEYGPSLFREDMGSILFLTVSPGAIPLRLDCGSYRGCFAVRSSSFFFEYSNSNCILLDSQRKMLHHDIHYVNVEN